jgi:hypothetical protein
VTPLESLALSRGTVDRVTHRRNDKQWLDAAWADPRTRVLVVWDGRAAQVGSGAVVHVAGIRDPRVHRARVSRMPAT